MDIAGLSKLTADTLVLIVSVLGFLVRPIAIYLRGAGTQFASVDLWICHRGIPCHR